MKPKADDIPQTNVASLSKDDASASRKYSEWQYHSLHAFEPSSTEQTIVSDWVKSIGEDCSKAPRDYLKRSRLPHSGE